MYTQALFLIIEALFSRILIKARCQPGDVETIVRSRFAATMVSTSLGVLCMKSSGSRVWEIGEVNRLNRKCRGFLEHFC